MDKAVLTTDKPKNRVKRGRWVDKQSSPAQKISQGNEYLCDTEYPKPKARWSLWRLKFTFQSIFHTSSLSKSMEETMAELKYPLLAEFIYLAESPHD